jgi:alpha/beta hydrolase fold
MSDTTVKNSVLAHDFIDTVAPTASGESVAVRLYGSKGKSGEPSPLVLHFHGGAFVEGDLDSGCTVAGLLATAGARVVSVAYPLSPEHPFPRPLEIGYEMLQWSYKHRTRLAGKGAPMYVAGEEAVINAIHRWRGRSCSHPCSIPVPARRRFALPMAMQRNANGPRAGASSWAAPMAASIPTLCQRWRSAWLDYPLRSSWWAIRIRCTTRHWHMPAACRQRVIWCSSMYSRSRNSGPMHCLSPVLPSPVPVQGPCWNNWHFSSRHPDVGRKPDPLNEAQGLSGASLR